MASVPHEPTIRPVFLGEATVDLILDASAAGPAADDRVFELADLDGDAWAAHLARLVGDQPIEAHPGGSIANAAAAFLTTCDRTREPVFVVLEQSETSRVRRPLWWPGYNLCVADLTARGIRVVGHPAIPDPETPGAVAVVGEPGRVTHLLVNRMRRLPARRRSGDLLVSRCDHLPLAGLDHVRSFRYLGILLTDDRRNWDAAATAARAPGRAWFFGTVQQVSAFEEFLGEVPETVELIGTDGARACRVRHDGRWTEFPVPPADHIDTDLGAGDAYLGGYLGAAVSGEPPEAAHAAGCVTAAAALAARGARALPTQDLNRIFPPIDRHSSRTDEGRLFRDVRTSPGITLVTGGQTGIDSMAAEAAAEAGLPTHIVFPQGHRREDRDLGDAVAEVTGRARTYELSSPSFRFRTWAIVYAADAVLIVDPTDGDGSAETRKAAEFFNRPLLQADPGPVDPERIADWIEDNHARVVLIAGNRRSRLASVGAVDTGREAVDGLVLGMTLANARRLGTIPAGSTGIVGAVGAPARAMPWVRRHGARFGVDTGELTAGTPRDLVGDLLDGRLDTVLTWPSLVPAEALDKIEMVPLGAFAIAYGFLGRDSAAVRIPRLAVQYQAAYDRFGRDAAPESSSILAIDGAAERRIVAGEADLAYDSYRTGATAARFGLHGFHPTHWESLTMMRRSGS